MPVITIFRQVVDSHHSSVYLFKVVVLFILFYGILLKPHKNIYMFSYIVEAYLASSVILHKLSYIFGVT